MTHESKTTIMPTEPYRWLFPAAALYSIAAVGVKAATHLGLWARMPSLTHWHGHEMVFGYALAVVGGFLVARARPVAVAVLLAAWLGGRVAALVGMPSMELQAMALAAFPVALFIMAGMPFVRAARKGSNRVFAAILGLFVVAECLFLAGEAGWLAAGTERGLLGALGLLMLLLFAMGGRLTAAATSGAHQKLGVRPEGFALPGAERAGLAALSAMAAADTLGLDAPAAVAAALGGMVILYRLWRWQVWRVAAQREVALLHAGFLGLGIGLTAKGALQGAGTSALEAYHLPAIAGLGILTVAVMSRVIRQRLRRPVVLPSAVLVAAWLLAAAAVLRAGASVPDLHANVVLAAAILWTAAIVSFLVFAVGELGRTKPPPRSTPSRGGG